MTERDIYKMNGFKDRGDYIQSLADDNRVDIDEVWELANLLGEDEDFDGLVTSVADLSEEGWE